MAVSLLSTPMYWVLNLVICILYPACKTFAHLFPAVVGLEPSPSGEDPRQNCGLYAHYLFYWTIYYVYWWVEYTLLSFLMPYVPLFYEAKLLLFFWLTSDHFKGSGYVYHRYVMKEVLHMCNLAIKEVDEKLDVRNKKSLTDVAKHVGSIEDVNFRSMEC
ncbi:hypothetical protein BgAZ_402070 [Babesia gibsoni]|uniref:HVA22-like protein n=1 Tax=Babesia gibsoni TaxID=33632 RepID=A0AAD8LIG1_BABGI|nr:hypothetical protein BgAZ_402070 [Babesia gibsoni]